MDIPAPDLILTDAEGEAQADELLAALSDLAYATPTTHQPEIVRKHKSRFFFHLSSSLADDVQRRRKKVKPKVMVHIDQEIEKRLKDYKAEIPEPLAANILAVREFFLTRIGPRSMASGAGSTQAKQVVQRLLNTEIDSTQFDKFERMSHEAVNLVMAKFIARYYGLPKKDAVTLLASLQPRQPMYAPIPAQPPATPYESRHAKGRKENAQRENKDTDKGQE